MGDPKDPERVYSMDTFLQVTDDGGMTWSALGDQSKHWDAHAFWIDPCDTDHYLTGNDGGVYESFDRGSHLEIHDQPARHPILQSGHRLC